MKEIKDREFKSEDDQIKYLSESEITRFLEYIKADSFRNYAIFLLAYQHGLRASEIGVLKIGDYDKEDRRIYIRRIKGGISATYKISLELSKALNDWLKLCNLTQIPEKQFLKNKSNQVLFLSRKDNPIGRKQLDTLMKFYGEKVDLPEDKRHFHSLRHSCAVSMISRGVPIVQVKDWLGHRSINSTMIYAKVRLDTRDKTSEVWEEISKDTIEGIGRDIRKGKKEKKEKIGINWKGDKK